MNRDITIDTHVEDVVNLFKWEGIESAVLCGHSYGGIIISCAIERLRSQVSSIVFVDAIMPENSDRVIDYAARAR